MLSLRHTLEGVIEMTKGIYGFVSIDEAAKKFAEAKEKCEKEGHIKEWLPYTYNGRDYGRFGLEKHGHCTRCLESFHRYLTDEEWAQRERARQNMYKPMTI